MIPLAAAQLSDALFGDAIPIWIRIIWGAALGAGLGSYLGAASWRLPRRISMSGRSHCPGCGRQLRPSEMIPVFSYLKLRGRSSCCDQKLSVAYAGWELFATLCGAILGVVIGVVIWMGIVVFVMLAVAAVAGLRARSQ